MFIFVYSVNTFLHVTPLTHYFKFYFFIVISFNKMKIYIQIEFYVRLRYIAGRKDTANSHFPFSSPWF